MIFKSHKIRLILGVFIGILVFTLIFGSGAFLSWFVFYNKGVQDGQQQGKIAARKEAVTAGFYKEDSNFLNYAPVIEASSNWINNKVTQSAWIPYWNFSNSVSSYYAHPSQFTSLSPVWFQLKDDGSVDIKSFYANGDLLSFAKAHSTKIIPTVSNFSSDTIKLVLKDDSTVNKFTSDIIKEVNTFGFDGIDLDFEQIEITDKDNFMKLLNSLADQLHAKNRILSVTVLPKYTDLDVYSSLKQTRQVMDYQMIGKIADEVRLMTYGYTSESGYTPGPVAPIEWVESVAQYASLTIPKEKVILGIPLYSIGWDVKGGIATAYTFDQIKNVIPANGAIEDTTKENTSIVNIKGTDKTLWYSNKATVDYRKNIAKKYGLKGVVYWSLGNEDQNIWTTN